MTQLLFCIVGEDQGLKHLPEKKGREEQLAPTTALYLVRYQNPYRIEQQQRRFTCSTRSHSVV